MIILGISISWINIATNIYFQTTVPAEILGKLFSLLQTAATASLPFGTITYTFLFQMLSNGAIIFIISGLLMISYLLFLIPSFHKSIKNHQ
ncbi:hypothetical protein FD21_GL000452 [Liquorilactobacillus vini DSM 20605]|uniref:Major facilitator superfamily (MFS) profile domain-containing protein n=1 Tax=Liquorilactobacillus vini DSM 20605 TaxID=1133569 RepID=A0A0R2CAZ0_9LACO|nr:hypothetical protein FD21_GL000452 [Liquorilactobacillus vini DSM 20605]